MLDRIDYALLRLLRKNARLPNKDLAEKVGIAPSTALERVRRMREAKILLGYHAEIAPEAMGVGLQAMISVRLARHSRALVDGFHQHLLGLPEVLACYHVAGPRRRARQRAPAPVHPRRADRARGSGPHRDAADLRVPAQRGAAATGSRGVTRRLVTGTAGRCGC